MTKQQPILITGIPRSGTSMIAASINLCGAFAGEMSKRGRYSNDRIREEYVKLYLRKLNKDMEGHYPLPNGFVNVRDWKEQIDAVMYQEGYTEGQWMYKDYRLCLMWQVWNKAYPGAKWVIVRRKTPDIINSCLKTGYMIRFKSEKAREAVGAKDEREGWLWMVHEYEKRFTEMVQELNCIVIWPERMVQGNYDQMHELIDWLGLQWKDEVLEYINPLLWGSKERRS